MMKTLFLPLSLALLLSSICSAQLSPLSTFGGGDGWLAPGEGGIDWLTSNNNQRGLDYNPVSGNLILPTRGTSDGNVVKVIDGSTGAAITNLAPPSSGFAGGTFVINAAGVADDGAIYVGNLSTSAASPFKVYRWSNEADVATEAFNGMTGLNRVGDAFAATGSGAGTVLASAGTDSVNASNFASFSSADGLSYAATAYTSIVGTTTTSNDYRLSLTFIDEDTLIGNQGAQARITDFSGGSATLVDSIPLGSAQRPFDYTVLAGVPLLAVIDSNSSDVQVFDITTPSSPVLLASGNNTTGMLTANVNGAGGLSWGTASGNSATLYAMSTNQGIQAFTFTIPEPSAFALISIALGGLLLGRRRR